MRRRIAFGLLLANAAGCALAIGATVGVAMAVSRSLGDKGAWRLIQHFVGTRPDTDGIAPRLADHGRAMLAIWAAWSFALGCIASFGLSHLKRRTVWLLLIGGLAAIVAAGTLLDTASHARNNRSLPLAITTAWEDERPMVEFVALGLAVALLAIPLGPALRRTTASMSRTRRIHLMSRARKRRAAQ
jgi:hypothetical protein